MFDAGGDDVLFASGNTFNDSEDGVIVGFRAPTGEDDFLRARAEQRGNLLARGFDGRASFLSKCVKRRGIAEF
jgi:hypothetical protein